MPREAECNGIRKRDVRTSPRVAKRKPTRRPPARAASESDALPFWRDGVLWLLIAAGALLIFTSLAQRCLWQDEAETALLGRNIVKYGRPVAFDGVNLVSQELGAELDENKVWRWSPWIQFYLAAASIKLLGATTFAARLPFAILGVLTIPAIYALTSALFRSRLAARLAAAFAVTSVPFLLHVRQARWYAAAYLCIALVLIAAVRARPIVLVIFGTLLFYTNYFVAIVAMIALALAAPLLSREKAFLLRVWGAIAGVAVLSLPGVVYYHVLSRGAGGGGAVSGQLAFYAVALFTFLLPLPIALLLPFTRTRGVGFGVAFVAVYVAVLSFAPWRMFRYETLLLPMTCALMGVVCASLFRRNATFAVIVIALLVATNVLHQLPLGYMEASGSESHASISPLASYAGELANGVHDPECAVADYLNRHAKPGETLLTSYGDLPLMYYTQLHVTGGLAGAPLPPSPDWILARTFLVSDDPRKDPRPAAFMRRSIDLSPYREALSVPDPALSNDPDPRFHLFSDPKQAAYLKLMHR